MFLCTQFDSCDNGVTVALSDSFRKVMIRLSRAHSRVRSFRGLTVNRHYAVSASASVSTNYSHLTVGIYTTSIGTKFLWEVRVNTPT